MPLFRELKPNVKPLLLTVYLLLSISGCATSGLSGVAQSDDQALETSSQASLEGQIEAKLEPPKLDLDAQLLEQLMIANFASYAGDWSSATTSSLTAAELSQDFRLARMAAVLALRSKSYAKAAQASELWYQLDSDSQDAYNVLIIGLLGSGNVDGAIEYFDQRLEVQQLEAQQSNETSEQQQSIDQTSEQDGALSSSEYQADTLADHHIRQIAGLLVRQDNASAALEVCDEYVRREPQSAQALLSMAYVANYFDRKDKAQQWLDQALVLRPNWDVAAQMYANMLGRDEKHAERLAYIRLYINDNPQSVVMRIQYAAELARQQDYQAGLDVMQAVVVDAPNNSSAIIYAAALAQQLEQIDLAQGLYEKALELEPNNDDVLWSLARFAIADDNYRKAERYYERIKLGDNYFRAQLQIANMRYEIKGLTSAINVLRRLEPRTEGEFVEIALARHYLLMQDGEHEDAFGYINDSLVYLPDNDDLVYARALVAAELKDLNVAEADFRSIIQRHPDHANALNALGYTLADQTDRYAEAKELILKALELRPDQGHILDSMGWVMYRLQDYESAISYLRQAFEVMPEVEVATHLGEVYWEDGQRQQALDIWKQAYAIDANNELLIKTLERYGQLELYAIQDID